MDSVPAHWHRMRRTVHDVLRTRCILLRFIPPELIDIILELAEYWACVMSNRSTQMLVKASTETEPTSEQNIYLQSARVPRGSRVRRVTFRVRSCDQGKSNNAKCRGTYKGTSSWFEVGVVEAPQELVASNSEPDLTSNQSHSRRWFLQSNIHGARYRKLHEVVWSVYDQVTDPASTLDESDGAVKNAPNPDPNRLTTGSGSGRGFLENLHPGSSISLYAQAKYPGWENHVFSAEIEMECFL
ncbi:hypothetical protein DFP72DRAFT_882653 [Ephemerocybe angulata]|uniref:Uncharacterized protein n=1 Tax=Ephemerocybe angulata TaxID=980116 RepID=A0A8H6I833_9AGAR|nr:hypothetical protein DFP72DRAFT_882653 [Tulosesus angulatus]